jgi:hypothetical protein
MQVIAPPVALLSYVTYAPNGNEMPLVPKSKSAPLLAVPVIFIRCNPPAPLAILITDGVAEDIT